MATNKHTPDSDQKQLKKVYRSNFRVEVTPRSIGNFGGFETQDWAVEPDDERRAQLYERRCKDIEEQIKRHVDNVDRIDIRWDEEVFCAFCGEEWVPSDDGLSYCCDEALAAQKGGAK